MFNMLEIGKRIAKLRKEKNMTQVELADKLGISYQAVSNWERGDSMPDIAKLSDLSLIFDVTIDEILGNKRQAKIINQIINEEEVIINDIEKEDLEELLPIVKPEQFKKSFNDFKGISFEQLLMLAPFLNEEEIDEIVRDYFDEVELEKLIALAPFMSEKTISEVFLKNANNKDEVSIGLMAGLAPFVSEEVLDEVFEKVVNSENVSVGSLASLAPFVSSKTLGKAVKMLYKKQGVKSIVALLPFMEDENITEIYNLEVEKGNFQDLIMLMPFMKDGFKNIFKKKHDNKDEE
ncbi:MAG: helix-turn-helix domain-containing protein [Acholeplasma sp.]|nr:helix-turn-helix domain-containing protein [Acholeplasma sp.]